MSYTAHHVVIVDPTNQTPNLGRAMNTFNENEWLPLHCYEGRLVLYHYTDFAGMKGIIESRSIWHTNAEALNDQKEIRHGLGVIREAIEERKSLETDEFILVFIDSLLFHLESLFRNLYITFVASFSMDGNLQSQWQAYGDRGRGYSLGFEFSNKTKRTSDISHISDPSEIILRRVLYDQDQQKGLVISYLNNVIESIRPNLVAEKQLARVDRSVRASTRAVQAMHTLAEMAVTFKVERFRKEQEWRLIRIIQDSHETDSIKPTYLFHNTPASILEFPLTSVMVGPALPCRRSQSEVTQLIQQLAGAENPIQIGSKIQVTCASSFSKWMYLFIVI